LPTGGGDFPDQTIVLPPQQREVVPPARFQRLQPPGRSDIVTLNRTHYLMGRLPSCDLRLFSQTASREHARLTARDGRWYLTPVPGKLVLVNGSPVKEEVPLTHKMRLQLGGDELLFLDESGARVAEGDEAPQGGMTELVDKRWLWAVIGLLAVAVVLWWVLR
jgi:pSer/pThr/pTyr-binding forkhead associated (FHA) protein